uniref:Uncharacterized protein n=1 Tax=Neobacillus citreus TaxID=2833578 RepID=A0A942T0H6_9BACI
MHREFDTPPRRWPLGIVAVIGALLGGLEVFGIVGIAWVSDPDVTQPIVTEHDWWPPDSALLGAVAFVGIPAAMAIGCLVAAGLHALGSLVDDTLGTVAAVLITAGLSALVGFLGGFPVAHVIQAPVIALPFAVTAAGVLGAVTALAALRTRGSA